MPYPLGGAVRLSDDIIVEPGQFFRSAVAVVEGAIKAAFHSGSSPGSGG